MISFIQLPLRTTEEEAVNRHSLRPVTVAVILGLILCFQIGLVLWVFFRLWQG